LRGLSPKEVPLARRFRLKEALMRSTDTHSTVVDADCAKQLLALELAVTAMRRRVFDLDDRLYRELRLRGMRV
jgi:hypothetical protein